VQTQNHKAVINEKFISHEQPQEIRRIKHLIQSRTRYQTIRPNLWRKNQYVITVSREYRDKTNENNSLQIYIAISHPMDGKNQQIST